MRDRLIELVKASLIKHIDKSCKLAENIAEDLLSKGVIVPPCKVGDMLYVPCPSSELGDKAAVFELEIVGIGLNANGEWLALDTDGYWQRINTDDGYLTRGAAEKALERIEK